MNTFTTLRRIVILFTITFLFSTLIANAQVDQLLDNFNRSGATVGTPTLGAPAWTEVESGTSSSTGCNLNSNYLRLSSSSPASREYIWRDCSSNYNTTLNANPGKLLWEFKMRLDRDDATGFANAGYGMAVILGSTSSSFHNAGNGYAVVLGNPSGNIPIRLVKFTGGFSNDTPNLTNLIAFDDYDDNEDVLAVRVIYTPGTDLWELFIDDDDEGDFGDVDYTDADLVGSINDGTYTGQNLKFVGALFNHGTSTSPSARLEEIYIPLIITPSYYYSKASGNLDVLSTWGKNLDGSGAAPSNFTTNGQRFNIRNGSTHTIGANWSVSGVQSNVTLGDSVNLITFDIPAGFAFSGATATTGGPLDISAHSKLVIENALVPVIGLIDYPSVVEYASASTQTIRPVYYWDLICTSTGGRTWASGTTGILDTFIIGANAFTTGGGTVDFAGSQPQFVPPIRYPQIINTGGGDRILSPTGIIIVGDQMTPSIGMYTVTGSTVQFDDDDDHTVPVLYVASGPNYNNLIISGDGDYVQEGAMTIGGDLTLIDGQYYQNTGTTIFPLTINGNLNIAGGDYFFNDDTGANILFLKGNLTQTVGRARIDGSVNGRITFNGSGNQQIISAQDSIRFEDVIFNINAGAYVKLAQNIALDRNSTITRRGSMTVNSGGTLDCGVFRISAGIGTSGTTVFNLNSGGTLITASPTGVTGTILPANITTTYNSGANYKFNGGQPQTTNLVNTTLHDLAIDNTANVTLNATINATGNINFLNGKFITGVNKISLGNLGTVTGAGAGKYVQGTFEKFINTGTTSKSFEIGDPTSYNPVDLTFPAASNATGSIIANVHTGDHPTLPGSGINPALTVNRYWTLVNNGVSNITPFGATFGFVNPNDMDAGANALAFVVRNYSGGIWHATTTGTVTTTSTQGNGNPNFGDFQVGEPFPPPTVTCPATVNVNAPSNSCSAIVSFSVTTTGNPTPTLSYSQNPGTSFNVGTTPVTATVTNINGSNSCTFDVIVHDVTLPIISDCPTDISEFVDYGVCEKTISWTPPTATDNCGVTLTSDHNPDDLFPVGTTPVTYTATDASGNIATCTFNVTVIDDQFPVITGCPGDVIYDTQGSCGLVVDWIEPTATDNCLFTFSSNFHPNDYFPVGVTTVTYNAVDASANISTCSFTVTIVDIEDPIITCPADIAVNNDPGICGAVVNFTVGATDNCNVTVVSTPASGSLFPVGNTLVNSVATDASGRTASCSFNITVADNEAPVITCPADTIVNTDPLVYGKNVSFVVGVTDNCSATVVSSPPSGSFFAFGVTTVNSIATDAAGHSVNCSFNVTVVNALTLTINSCDTYTFPWGGSTTVSGPFSHVYTGGNGLDSTVLINVIINYVNDNSVCTIDACDVPSGTVSHTFINIDDNNVCTTDGCDPITGVHNDLNPVVNDNNLCTADGCDPINGEYHNIISIDDNSVCTIDDCTPLGGITHTLININDGDACTADVCDPITGTTHNPVDRDDHNLCTMDGCDPGYGVFYISIAMDDVNPCTDDVCDPLTGNVTHPTSNIDDNDVCTSDGCTTSSGVFHTPNDNSDGNACTLDICDADLGVFHIDLDVDDGNVCTVDGCNTLTGPTHFADPVIDDNNLCTADICDPINGPTHITLPIEDDNNICTLDGCDPLLGPTHTLLAIVDDNNTCTTDGCNSITGPTHDLNPIIDDNNVCTTDGCDPLSGPTHVSLAIENDGNACTTDGCDPLTGPTHVTDPIQDDNNVCTLDGCNTQTGPTHDPLPIEDDGNLCTTDGCDPLTGPTHTTNPIVDDNSVCTTDGCNSVTGPTHVENPIEDDNNICTLDACDPLTGPTHNPLPTIDDGNACTTDGCNTLTGPSHDLNQIVDDNNICTTDGCNTLTGPTHDPLPIEDDNNACTTDACDPVNGPTHVAITFVDDNNACTADGCNTLTGPTHDLIPIEDDANVCTADACDPLLGPTHNALPIVSDNNACTTDGCNSVSGPTYDLNPIVNDNNVCTTDGCDPISGETHTPLAIVSDNNVCTTDGCDPITGETHNTLPIVSDNNVCTTDGCDPVTGPTHVALPIVDDNNVCTTDGCDPITGPTHNPLPIVSDNNICTTDGCDPITGETHNALPIVSDNNVCTTDGCDPITGPTHNPLPIVSDNNVCTTDGCDPITGETHNPLPIVSDNNVCTTDGCDPITGPTHNPLPIVSDNNVCTTDGCDPITGETHNPLPIVSDNNVCTADGCDPITGETHNPLPIVSDNNVCTTDGCDPITGPTHNPLPIVSDNNVCTTDGCDPITGETHNPLPIVSDNNVCTTDGCDPITGETHNPLPIVSDNNVCTTDGCDPITGPTHNPLPIVSDNNVCTTDGCDPITGETHNPLPIVSDNNVCTTDGCDPVSGPTHNPLPIVSDNNVCTTDGCDPITGETHNPLPIVSDNNVCTTDGCDPITGETHNPLPIVSDNNVCTTDGCDPITGETHTTLPIVSDNNVCTTDGCDPITGEMHNPLPIVSDNNVCTTDGCDPVTGETHNPLPIVSDNNVCTVDGCDPISGPTHNLLPVISDNNVCTTDGCDPVSGEFHNPISIDDNNLCTTDACNPVTGPSHNPVNTNDNNLCTTDGCVPATGVFHNPVNTNDNNACTTDGCSPATGVFHTPVTTDDGNPCTTDACNSVSGVTHTPITLPAPTVSVVNNCGSSVLTASGFTGTLLWSTNATTTAITVNTAGARTVTQSLGTCTSAPGSGTAAPFTTAIVPGAIAGPLGACRGQNGIVFSVTPVANAVTYIWTLPTGATGSSSGPSITLNFGNTFVTGNISVRSVNPCGQSANSTRSIVRYTVAPAQPAAITGSASRCPSTSGIYSVAVVANTNNYVWAVTGGLTITSGQGTNAVVVSAPAGFVTGTVAVSAANCIATSAARILTVKGQPSLPIWKSAPPAFACAGGCYTFNIDNVQDATSYTYTAPAGCTITSSTNPVASNPHVTAKSAATICFPAGFISGNVVIFSSNACGNSASLTYAIRSVPQAPGPITGTASVCRSQTLPYSISAVPTATSYAWTVSGGAVVSTGQGTTNVTIRYVPATSANVTITVNAINSCGTSTPPTTKAIAVNLGCKNAGDASGINMETLTSLNVYPNPVTDKATISFESDRTQKYTIKVSDMIGQVILSERVSASEGFNQKEINLGNVAKGLYMISIQTEEGEMKVLQIVVEK